MENLDTKGGNMLDMKEEKQYEQLRRLGQKLHIPIPEAFLTLEVFDKDGKLIQRQHQRSHSWVRNAYNLMFCQLAGKAMTGDGFGAGKISFKQTSGVVLDAVDNPITLCGVNNPDAVGWAYREGAGQILHGILVGSGVNAEDFEDFVLQTPIAEGAGAGQLNHAQSEANVYSYGALVGTNTLIRYFNNNGGVGVDVNEVCLATATALLGNKYFIVSRDHLAATVTVPDTGQLKVTYTVQLTYPA